LPSLVLDKEWSWDDVWRWSKFWGGAFGAARLETVGDKRLVQLRIRCDASGGTARQIDDPASLKALYRLVDREEVTTPACWLLRGKGTLRLNAGGRGYRAGDSGHHRTGIQRLDIAGGIGTYRNEAVVATWPTTPWPWWRETRDVIGWPTRSWSSGRRRTRRKRGPRVANGQIVVAVVEGRQRGHSCGGGRSPPGGSGRPGARMSWSFWTFWSRRAIVRGAVAIQSAIAWKTGANEAARLRPRLARPGLQDGGSPCDDTACGAEGAWFDGLVATDGCWCRSSRAARFAACR